MGPVFTGLFPLQVVGMLSIPLLLEFILSDLAVAVQALAARWAVEDFTTTLGAAVMARGGLIALVEEADAG